MSSDSELTRYQAMDFQAFIREKALRLPPLAPMNYGGKKLHTRGNRTNAFPSRPSSPTDRSDVSTLQRRTEEPVIGASEDYEPTTSFCQFSPNPSPTATCTDETFTFITIHKPSGSTDSTGDSIMRSHIMRKYHRSRRAHSNK